MAPRADSGPQFREDRSALLRQIPSVDEILNRPRMAELSARAGRSLVTDVARRVIGEIRARLTQEKASLGQAVQASEVEDRILAEVEKSLEPSLRRVINATGVILHTNLGRAPLPAGALEHLRETATRYSNLEYDIASGARGKRDVHTGRVLAELLGAEAAILVNNNAAAVFLALNTLAKGAEVIVSRGELIEIGDGFRIPDIMGESGAVLREVGTTNRTRIADYERAINDRTKLLLRVHPSNFRITGFTERPTLEEMVALGRRFQIPVFEDLGSGCLADLSASGIAEPMARESLLAGASLVSFSGDKLLGGPQAGILAGKKELIERIRRNPLFRALRVDKLTIGILEIALRAYRRGALDEIPAVRMIRTSPEEIARRAKDFLERMRPEMPADAELEIREGFSVIGGGSTPDQQLPTRLVAVSSERYSAAELEDKLRRAEFRTPVIARIENDNLVLDLRTVFPDEEISLAAALAAALH